MGNHILNQFYRAFQNILSLESVDSFSESSNEIEKVCPKEVFNFEKLVHTTSKSQIITAEALEQTKQTETDSICQRAAVEHSILNTSKTLVHLLLLKQCLSLLSFY